MGRKANIAPLWKRALLHSRDDPYQQSKRPRWQKQSEAHLKERQFVKVGYLTLFSPSSIVPPVVEAGLRYFISSPLIAVTIRFCGAPI